MTYNQVINNVKNAATALIQNKTVVFANRQQLLTMIRDIEYPVISVFIGSVPVSQNKEVFNLEIILASRSAVDNLELQQDVLSDELSISNDLIALLKSHSYDWTVSDSISRVCFQPEGADDITGIVMTLTISSDVDFDRCNPAIKTFSSEFSEQFS